MITGFTGSLMVIAVNGWMNHPTGFKLVDGEVVDVQPVRGAVREQLPLARADPHVHRRLHRQPASSSPARMPRAPAQALGDRYHRTALLIPLTVAALAAPVQVVVGDWAAREVAQKQPIKLAAIEGLGQTTKGAPIHVLGWYRTARSGAGSAPRAALVPRLPRPDATVQGLDSVPRTTSPINVVRFAFQIMVGIGTFLAGLGRPGPGAAQTPAAARVEMVLPGTRGRRAAVRGRAVAAG